MALSRFLKWWRGERGRERERERGKREGGREREERVREVSERQREEVVLCLRVILSFKLVLNWANY